MLEYYYENMINRGGKMNEENKIEEPQMVEPQANMEPEQKYTEEEIKEAVNNLSLEEIDRLLTEVIKEME